MTKEKGGLVILGRPTLFLWFKSHNSKMVNSRGRHFQFTINNYEDEDLAHCRYLGTLPADQAIKYIAFGFEISATGTPHLQGCIGTTVRKTCQDVKTAFGNINPHIELARNRLANYRYAIKGGDFEEYGDVPSNNSGGRSDLERYQANIRGGMRLRELRDEHFGTYIRSGNATRELILQHMRPQVPDLHPLRGWQTDLYAILCLSVSDRQIHFVVDYQGNKGKTWFAKYYTWMRQIEDDVITIRPTKRENLAYMVVDAILERPIRTVFVDCSRDMVDNINYGILEELKDGNICSGKFVSRMVSVPPMHVVVLMNAAPDESKLSADRYVIHNI